MLLAVADNVTKAAWISLVRFWRKRSPTRIAGTSVAKATSTRRRVRRLIVAILRIQSRYGPRSDVPAGIRLRSPRHSGRHRYESPLHTQLYGCLRPTNGMD